MPVCAMQIHGTVLVVEGACVCKWNVSGKHALHNGTPLALLVSLPTDTVSVQQLSGLDLRDVTHEAELGVRQSKQTQHPCMLYQSLRMYDHKMQLPS